MPKQAQRLVETCPRCKGRGDITGPKLVELDPKDKRIWHALQNKKKRLALGGVLLTCVGMLIAFAMVLLGIYQLMSNPILSFGKREWGYACVIVGALVFVATTWLYLNWYRHFDTLYEQRQQLLFRYGIERGEVYKITNFDR